MLFSISSVNASNKAPCFLTLSPIKMRIICSLNNPIAEKAYPSADWVAVMGQGPIQGEAEDAAMNALARAFKTDIASLSEANQRFSQIVHDVAGKKSVAFNESKDFSNQVKTESSVSALIGVETGMKRVRDDAGNDSLGFYGGASIELRLYRYFGILTGIKGIICLSTRANEGRWHRYCIKFKYELQKKLLKKIK
jgi:hypothetical protein